MKTLNLPNKLTLLRVVLVPICMIVMLLPFLPDVWSRILSAAIFVITSLTDMLDGMIARKKHLITDFGKFLDPLADKILIIGVLLAFMMRERANGTMVLLLLITLFVIVFRELAVSGLRMIVGSKSSIVIAANWLGKLKTVFQMITVLVLLLEPIVLPGLKCLPSYICLGITSILTILSGWNYFRAYWGYIDPKE